VEVVVKGVAKVVAEDAVAARALNPGPKGLSYEGPEYVWRVLSV
jgi:hypothetical protein